MRPFIREVQKSYFTRKNKHSTMSAQQEDTMKINQFSKLRFKEEFTSNMREFMIKARFEEHQTDCYHQGFTNIYFIGAL